ncbi:cytidine deaminase-like protein [Coniochaeta sp. 2T2.1]|nr:cytidine deaminase-like protein [Coniochaeta sp. 2T2.1]
MFIGICGSICSGRSTVAQYLVEHHGFKYVYTTPQPQEGAAQTPGLPQTTTSTNGDAAPEAEAEAVARKHLPCLDPNRFTSPSPAANSRHLPLTKIAKDKMLPFSSPDLLLDFVTKHWQERYVTADLPTEAVLEMYSRRPFFLLISIDAPLGVRFERFRAKTAGAEATSSLEHFARMSDAHLYDVADGQLSLMNRASVRLLNTSSSLAHLYATLGKVDLVNEDRLRPSWDTYFMALASLAARRSNCMKRRVGCVLVREKRVISTGYNGTPRGLRNCGEGGCGRCNDGQGSGHGLTTCLCIHAEENALLEAGRERIREEAILYCDTCPCLTCSIKICQVGISEVVYSQGYSMDGDAAAVFREAGVRLRQFVPPAQGLIHLEKVEER